ncbi:MAG: ferredoxin [Nanopusillaceae archaeon]|jgi:ferredoxin
MTKIILDKNACISAGICIALAPEIFQWDEDNKAKVILSETNDKNLIEKAKNAEIACPAHAIKVL